MPTVKDPLTLSLANLHRLDGGKGAAAVTHALKQAIADVMDRPGDKAIRSVQLEMKLTPVLERDQAVLDTIDVQLVIKSKIPNRQTTAYPMLPTQDGRLLFQEDNPMDPRQTSFNFADRPQPVAAPPDDGYDDDDPEADAPDTAQL